MTYSPLVALKEEEGLIKGAPTFDVIDGNVYWVDSAYGGISPRGSFTNPMTTIDAAINMCTAGNNDHIFVKAGHSETLSNATSLNADIADVAIIGLGHGTQRPLITLDTANTATIPVTAANILFQNIIFSANFADIAQLFSLTTAPSFTLLDCKFTWTASAMNFVDIVDINTTDNAADDLTIARCEWVDSDTNGGTLVDVDGDIDGLTVLDNYLLLGVNSTSTVAMVVSGKDTSNVNIQRNFTYRLDTAGAICLITYADTTTTNTGLIAYNQCRHSDTGGEILATATTEIMWFDNYASGVAGKSGYLLPAADS